MIGFVYFVRRVDDTGLIKIGHSHWPERRVQELTTQSACPLKLAAMVPANMRTEFALHSVFAESHSHREWFHPSEKLLSLIADLNAGVPIEQAIDLTRKTGSIRKRPTRCFGHAMKPLGEMSA